jgi:hypothetical protein
MHKRLDLKERYKDHYRKEQKILDEYADSERDWAENLFLWYKVRKEEIPDDEYRAAAFFINKEYLGKAGSLTLLYSMFRRLNKELPHATKENSFYLLAYRFKIYAQTLVKGGFDGK